MTTKHTKETPAMITQQEADQLFADAERAQELRGFASDPDYVKATQAIERKGAEIEQWLRSYSGSFDFLLDMKARLISGRDFSPKQYDAIVRCYQREQDRLADQADRLLDEYDAKATSHPPINGCTLKGKHICKLSTAKTVVNYEPVQTAGFFELEGSIVKVQKAVHGSGKLYAKRLVIDEASKSGSFVYEPGLISKLRESDRLTKERAAELGQLYGLCMVCGATLTDEKSIERGIGPICFGKL